ncbi:hypothetical protein GT204_32760 [Streptomyces sp. SID4919]|nr:hypothetical protein [Streptomyces sp. SID4919]SCK32583.1 hypothetical protein YW7DRAFT_02617 [Streptomyces sp. AmelKG-E11A]
MACGIHVGYSDQVLRDVLDIPGWGVAYVVGLAVISELAALFPLLLVSDRWQPPRPRPLARPAWTASTVLGVGTLWQIAVAFTVESQTYLANGSAQTVWALTFAPLLTIPPPMTVVTCAYAERHRVQAHA